MPVDFLTTEQNRTMVAMLQNPMTCSWRGIFILMSEILLSLTSDGEGITGWELRFSSPPPVFWAPFFLI
jgi:hypothetical protein